MIQCTVTIKTSGELLERLSLNNSTVFCPYDLGRTGPQYRRRYDMGEVNTNGYRLHDNLQFSALLRAILVGIAASILLFGVLAGVFGVLVGLGWLRGITMLFREAMPDRLQKPFIFG
jgi:hypothetical protein